MSSKHIGIEEARGRLGDLVTAAQQGADIIITRNRRPAARLVAYQEDNGPLGVGEDVDKPVEPVEAE
ncbi:MAG TPA: type II toxin-antitoxin system Phd/YefM family antitoxin [Bacillota bacterium]